MKKKIYHFKKFKTTIGVAHLKSELHDLSSKKKYS
jgi:hypothetical protein